MAPFTTIHWEPLKFKKLASVNYAAKLVHTRRALLSIGITIISSHQEPVSGQAYNPPGLH